MLVRCIGRGLRAASRAPGLVGLLWGWTLVLAVLVAFPAWLWMGCAFDLSTESDRLLGGLNLAVIGELLRGGSVPVPAIVGASLVAVALLAMLANPLVSGGLIEALAARDGAPLLERFCRGAGRHYASQLELLGLSLTTAGLTIAGLYPLFRVVSARLKDSSWEPARVVGTLALALVGLLIFAVITLALDFARIRAAADGEARTPRTWVWALRFVLGRPATLGILVVPAAASAAIAALHLALTLRVPSPSWLWIVVLALVQQATAFFRAGLRVALVAAELEYLRAVGATPRGE